MKLVANLLIPLALFILAVFVMGTGLDKPFWGIHDWNGARYGNIAKNYLRYGLIETKAGQVENGGTSNSPDFIYYTHYQPLLPLLISVSYKALGVNEFATRAVPLTASAGFVVVLYFIGRELVSWQTGLFASLLALATPMVRYYGKNPVHEPMALFFASLSFLGAAMLIKGNRKGRNLLIAGFILTVLTNWSFVFLLMALSILLYGEKTRRNVYLLWLLGIGLAGLHFLHIKILTGSFFGGGLSEAFLERTSIDNAAVNFSVIGYILRIRLWASTLFTNTLLASALTGLVLLLRSKASVVKKFVFSVFIYCAYPLFFANASFIHSYFIYYLILPFALLGGYFCARMLESKKILGILVLGIVLSVWFEREGYIEVLNAGSGDRFAVELSKSIRDESRPGETVLVRPFEFAQSRMPILSYYSERNVTAVVDADWLVEVTGETYEITKTKTK